MLIPFGVALRAPKLGGQHVHQPFVSRLLHPRLRVRPDRVPRRQCRVHDPARPQDLPLRSLWLPPRPPSRPSRPPVPNPSHPPPPPRLSLPPPPPSPPTPP